jgi:hypothetical protein
VAVLAVLAGCRPHAQEAAEAPAAGADIRRQVWAALQPMAAARGLDPFFVYAVVGAESNFDPRARHGEARGLFQIKPEAWRLATATAYEPAVWDWRTNLSVGMDRLASAKATLEAKGLFSYRRLWALDRYGLDYLAARDFEMERIPRPSNPLGRALWEGEAHPLDPPK